MSYGTHAAFASFKRDFDRRLQATGVHLLKPKNLKPRHIETVLGQLRAEVAAGTRSLGSAKNWCSHLRAFVRLIDRRYLVPRTNAELGLRTAGLRAFGEQERWCSARCTWSGSRALTSWRV